MPSGRNLLDEKLKQAGVTILEQSMGMTAKLDLKSDFGR